MHSFSLDITHLLAAALLYALATLGLLWWGRTRRARQTPDLIVVLGCKVLPDGAPTRALARRVAVAVRLAHRWPEVPVLMTGHRGEAQAAAQAAIASGVPATQVQTEPLARDTRDNAVLTAAMFPDARHVVFVTDDYHLLRASWWFRQSFRSVAGVPAVVQPIAWRAAAREVVAVARDVIRSIWT
jgi:uncharacterized SAM-binding protein YcdF (DUF218 family)